MKYSEAQLGRVFILRLDTNEVLHETLEQFASDHDISGAAVIVVGGGGKDSTLIVGPRDSNAKVVDAMEYILNDAHEIMGTGTLFRSEEGDPVLHMHVSAGRSDVSVTGCVRRGVKVWGVLEVVLFEIKNTTAVKKYIKDFDNYMLYP
jgi:predicted DNA-binding protein with PD1-like motif